MPVNRNTLLRYKTIDRKLRGGQEATLEELIDACNDALYDYNGYEVSIISSISGNSFAIA